MANLIALYDGSQNGQAPGIINLIILPEIGTRTATRTINTLAQIQPSARVFEFLCNLSSDENNVWASLVQKANDLLGAVLQQPQLCNYPLIFLCHGLSGLVAKRILGVLDERYYDTSLKVILAAYSGSVFVSTPQLTYSKTDRWQQLGSLLRSCPGFAKWQSQNEIATIANVCAKFQSAPFDQPVLSVYEGRETKLGDGWRHKKMLLVDRELAEVRAKDEVLLSIDADHHEIFQIDSNGELCRQLSMFFQKVQYERRHSEADGLLKTMQGPEIAANDDDRDTWASTTHAPGGAIGRQDDDRQTSGVDQHISADATKGTTDAVSQESAGTATILAPLDAPHEVKLPCYFLHSYVRNAEFSGRDDILDRLDDVLLLSQEQRSHGVSQPHSIVLSGLGGIGKTQCALEYAFSRQHKFDAVLWAHADTAAKLDESYSQISVSLGLEGASKAGDRVISRNLVMEWLSNPIVGRQALPFDIESAALKANWLLIFDNADDPMILADFWPSSGTGAIIVTSRDPLAKKYFSSHSIDLESFAPDTAATLLRRLSEASDSPQEVQGSKMVAERLGGLPLAISLAAAAILRQELTFEEFLSFYEVEPTAADIRPISLRPETQYQHTLSTVWALDSLQESAKCLLRLLSVMDPDSIDERIITQTTSRKLPRGFSNDKPAFINARTSLLKSSLVKRDKASSHLSIHRLTQDFTRIAMTFAELSEYFSAALHFCMLYWPKPVVAVSYARSSWPASEAVVPHLLFLRKLWEKQPALADDVSVKHQLADLTWRVAWYFTERGNPVEDVESLLVSSHHMCESDPSINHSDTHSQAVFALSAIYGFENDPVPCLEYAKINLDINITMGTDPKTSQFLGMAHNQVGYALLTNHRFAEAEQSFRKGAEVYGEWKEVRERNFRPEFIWGGLALALSQLGGLEEAAQIFLDTIAHRRRMFGPADTDSVKLGWAMLGLGGVRFKQGRLDESLDAYIKALANLQITSGPRYFRTGHAHLKLGEHYALRRRFTEADFHYRNALRVFQGRKAYKGEVAMTLHQLSKLYVTMGEPEAKIHDLESQALSLYVEVVSSGRLAVLGGSLDDTDYGKVVGFYVR